MVKTVLLSHNFAKVDLEITLIETFEAQLRNACSKGHDPSFVEMFGFKGWTKSLTSV